MAHSSTEAEFVAANEAGKMAKYLRTLLQNIGSPQEEATIIFIDNTGALMMANARQPTRRTRHMDIKHFGIRDWVEQDLVILEQIRSPQNSSDSLTKALARMLYYVHKENFNLRTRLQRACFLRHQSLCFLRSMGGVMQ